MPLSVQINRNKVEEKTISFEEFKKTYQNLSLREIGLLIIYQVPESQEASLINFILNLNHIQQLEDQNRILKQRIFK